MTDVVTVGAGGGSIARRAPDGRLKVGPRAPAPIPGPMCYGRGGREPTVTDATLVLGRIPPHLLGGEIPLDVDAGRAGDRRRWPRRSASTLHRTAAGVLEIAAWSQANAVRQVTVKRGLDVRDYVLVAFGGSGPLQAGKLVDILGLQAALVPPDPGNVSAFGLLTVDVKNDYVTTAVQRDDLLDLERVERRLRAPRSSRPAQALAAEGFASRRDAASCGRPTCATSARPGRCGSRCPTDRSTAPPRTWSSSASTPRTSRPYGYSYAASPDQRIEWVNCG